MCKLKRVCIHTKSPCLSEKQRVWPPIVSNHSIAYVLSRVFRLRCVTDTVRTLKLVIFKGASHFVSHILQMSVRDSVEPFPRLPHYGVAITRAKTLNLQVTILIFSNHYTNAVLFAAFEIK